MHKVLFVHGLGLLYNGTGGGEAPALLSASGFLGGGGGALFLRRDEAWSSVSVLGEVEAVSALGETTPFPPKPLTLFAMSYFLFNAPAPFQPAAT